MTQGEISRQSGVSATAMYRATRRPRMTTAAADALLAVQPQPKDETRQATAALRSLVADGWTLPQLPDATGLNVRTMGATVNGHTTPNRAAQPPFSTPTSGCAWRIPATPAQRCGPAGAPPEPGGTRRPGPHTRSTLTRSLWPEWSTATSHRCGRRNDGPPCNASPATTPTRRSPAASASTREPSSGTENEITSPRTPPSSPLVRGRASRARSMERRAAGQRREEDVRCRAAEVSQAAPFAAKCRTCLGGRCEFALGRVAHPGRLATCRAAIPPE